MTQATEVIRLHSRTNVSIAGENLADLPPVITVKEMAQLLRLSRSAAYRRIEAGQIEAFKLGERWFVPTAPLMRKLGLL
jgi:excisionase family DNA binding protein